MRCFASVTELASLLSGLNVRSVGLFLAATTYTGWLSAWDFPEGREIPPEHYQTTGSYPAIEDGVVRRVVCFDFSSIDPCGMSRIHSQPALVSKHLRTAAKSTRRSADTYSRLLVQTTLEQLKLSTVGTSISGLFQKWWTVRTLTARATPALTPKELSTPPPVAGHRCRGAVADRCDRFR